MFKCTVTFLELQFVNHTDHLGNLVIFHRGQLKRERTGRIHAYLKKNAFRLQNIWNETFYRHYGYSTHINAYTITNVFINIHIKTQKGQRTRDHSCNSKLKTYTKNLPHVYMCTIILDTQSASDISTTF